MDHPFANIDSSWRHSPLWFAMEDHLRARIEEHRDALETTADDRKRDRLQARIAECRHILALAEEKVPAPTLAEGISKAGY